MNTQYKLKVVSLAVTLGLSVSSNSVSAQEQDSQIEEVVVKASRLQGSAAAVVEEEETKLLLLIF